MGTYQVVAVGTDGSPSSFRAVDRAAMIAADSSATLLIICAFHGSKSSADEDADQHVIGSSPAEKTLQEARERAAERGVTDVDTIAVEGDPVESVIDTVTDRRADLLVVGNKGLNSITGRLIGSVPQGISRRSPADVLIVHTT